MHVLRARGARADLPNQEVVVGRQQTGSSNLGRMPTFGKRALAQACTYQYGTTIPLLGRVEVVVMRMMLVTTLAYAFAIHKDAPKCIQSMERDCKPSTMNKRLPKFGLGQGNALARHSR